MELIGLALGLKVGGEGIRNRGLPWLQGLSAGWMGMAFTDMEGGKSRFGGAKAKFGPRCQSASHLSKGRNYVQAWRSGHRSGMDLRGWA